ncbi:MAG: hypothetical protein R3F11_15835 [Verrucomicrobiales bacterium]
MKSTIPSASRLVILVLVCLPLLATAEERGSKSELPKQDIAPGAADRAVNREEEACALALRLAKAGDPERNFRAKCLYFGRPPFDLIDFAKKHQAVFIVIVHGYGTKSDPESEGNGEVFWINEDGKVIREGDRKVIQEGKVTQ